MKEDLSELSRQMAYLLERSEERIDRVNSVVLKLADSADSMTNTTQMLANVITACQAQLEAIREQVKEKDKQINELTGIIRSLIQMKCVGGVQVGNSNQI